MPLHIILLCLSCPMLFRSVSTLTHTLPYGRCASSLPSKIVLISSFPLASCPTITGHYRPAVTSKERHDSVQSSKQHYQLLVLWHADWLPAACMHKALEIISNHETVIQTPGRVILDGSHTQIYKQSSPVRNGDCKIFNNLLSSVLSRARHQRSHTNNQHSTFEKWTVCPQAVLDFFCRSAND